MDYFRKFSVVFFWAGILFVVSVANAKFEGVK